MSEQFFTFCRKCGQQILMTRNQMNGKWIPCDPELRRFTPRPGGRKYVTPEGGTISGMHDKDGQFGYQHHGRTCYENRQRNA